MLQTEQDITVFLNTVINKNPNDYEIIGNIGHQLLEVVATAPIADNKEQYIHQYLKELLYTVDLSKSFSKKLIFIYDDAMMPEILLSMHSWFLQQCCKVENIVIIITTHPGISSWYQQYLKLFRVAGFTIIEATFLRNDPHFVPYAKIPKIDNAAVTKKLQYYFSFYGGTYNSLERDFLTAMMSSLDNLGFIDYCGFSKDISGLDNYLEQVSNFSNRELLDKLLEIIKEKNFNIDRGGILNKSNFTTFLSGFIWEKDKISCCQLVRETLNDIPYPNISEKTLRSIMHCQIPIILTGGNPIAELEKFGFNLNYKLVDYNYIYNGSTFFDQIMRIIEQINTISKNYTLHDLEDYMIENKEIFWDNYNHIISGNMYSQIKNNIIKELSNG
jgi:hypothetical protein